MYTTNNAFDLYEEQFSQPERNLPGEGDEPKKRPEIEPEKLPDENPGIQPDTKPKKEDDDDDADDDDYTPYTEPTIGDDPDKERVKIPIM